MLHNVHMFTCENKLAAARWFSDLIDFMSLCSTLFVTNVEVNV